MIERYHRNPAKPANEDVAELVFLVSEERVQITYHTEEDKISASTREFIKPSNADEKGASIQCHPDNHSTFQVIFTCYVQNIHSKIAKNSVKTSNTVNLMILFGS